MSTKPSRPRLKERLTRQRVILAALRIVDRDGLDALTMRALGRELGVDPMAVYHHLPNKAAVLDGVTEAVLTEVSLETPEHAPWQEKLAVLARSYRTALLSHPNAIFVVATRPDVTPAALGLLDAAIGILLRAGFDPTDAVVAVVTASSFVIGNALGEAGLLPAMAESTSEDEVLSTLMEATGTGAYPNLLAAMSTASDLGMDHAFETGLTSLIAGFDAVLRP